MQSLALAFLLQEIFTQRPESTLSVGYWFRYLSVLLLIILVWHEYAIGSVAFAWILDIFDSCIPFLFGITQYLMIYYANPTHVIPSSTLLYSQSWLGAVLLFTLVGVIAYWNQYRKVLQYMQGYEFISASRFGLISSLFAFFVVAFLFILSSYDLLQINKLPDFIVPSIVLIIVVAHAIRIHLVWKELSQT